MELKKRTKKTNSRHGPVEGSPGPFSHRFLQRRRACTAYMHALVTAVTENDVELRILLESSAFNGLENRIGIRWFLDELGKEEGLNNSPFVK